MTTTARVELMGCAIDSVTLAEAVRQVEGLVAAGGPHTQVSVNAYKMVELARNPALRQLAADSDLITADGAGVVLASHILGSPLPERVPGIDLFCALMERAATRGWRPYLLGATPEVLEAVVSHYGSVLPALELAGFRSGYFEPHEEAGIAEEIRASGADLLFVGISSPKKEQFLADWGPTMRVPFMMGVGGAFDVVAGRVARAPRWLQRCHLEWAWRTAQEPRRLFQRPLRDSGVFALRVARARLLG